MLSYHNFTCALLNATNGFNINSSICNNGYAKQLHYIVYHVVTQLKGSWTHLARVVREDEREQNKHQETDSRYQIVVVLRDDEDVNEYVDQDADEENGGQNPRNNKLLHVI